MWGSVQDDDGAEHISVVHLGEGGLDVTDADLLGDEGTEVEAALLVEVDEHREVARGKAVAVPARLQRATAAEDLDERQGDLLVGGRDAHEDNGAGEVAGKEGLLVGLRAADRLDDDGKPEGWRERPLDEIADFLNGLALQKFPATDPDDSLAVIKIAELRNGVSAKSDRASREVPAKYVIKDGDFLFSWSGSLLAKFWTEGEGALNQHLFKVTSERYPMWFISHWVHHHLEEFQAIAASKATTMGHIQRGHLKAAMTLCPPDDVLKGLGGVMAPLVEQSIHNELESRSLAQLRDTLLPKLISGELRIAEAERFLTRAEALDRVEITER